MSDTALSTEVLSGFEVVESDSVPFITLDRFKRFYINSSARRLLNAEPYKRMSLAYNPVEQAIAILTNPDALPTIDTSTSNYNVDKRYYMSARHFFNKYAFNTENAPYLFDYVKSDDSGSVFVFKLRE